MSARSLTLPTRVAVTGAAVASALLALVACQPDDGAGTSSSDTPMAVTTAAAASATPTVTRAPSPVKRQHAGGVPSDAKGPYRVTRVVDGDTVHVAYKGRDTTVRLIGIDTPETVDPRKPVECFGRQASAHAHALLDGHKVYVAGDPTQSTRDKYGRLLAYLWLPGGKFVNYNMVRQGYAHEYTYDLPYRYQSKFRTAQAWARTHDKGLWSPSTCNGHTDATKPPTHRVTSQPTHRVTSQPTHRPTHTSQPPTRPTIRPGAFCANADEGKSGYSSSGVRYVCKGRDANGHLHWRRP